MPGFRIPIVLLSPSDPRLRLSVVIMALQVLGQVSLGFKISIAQILVSILACAMIEMAITYRQQGVLIWPASAILTGNSTAFILRANGTHHGDWWSLNGAEYFIIASVAAMLSKYLLRVGGRHLYNPSNLGLVLCFLAFGVTHVFPQYLWWGRMSQSIAVALSIILVGAVWVLRPLRMLPMVTAFLLTFSVLIALLAANGRCFIAIWHTGPVCGTAYWLNIVTSPELLVFVFFMISDPRTAPKLPLSRLAFGVAIALVAAALVFFQPSEFGIKVAVLSSLVVACSFVPALDRLAARLRSESHDKVPSPVRIDPKRRLLALSSGLTLSALAAAVITLAIPLSVMTLATDQQVIAIEAGEATLGAPSQ